MSEDRLTTALYALNVLIFVLLIVSMFVLALLGHLPPEDDEEIGAIPPDEGEDDEHLH